MSENMEIRGRADLIEEILRLREENEKLRKENETLKAPQKIVIHDGEVISYNEDGTVKPCKPSPPDLFEHLVRKGGSGKRPERPTASVHERDDDYVEFSHAEAIRETELALLVRLDGEEIWFPKASIHDDSETYEDRTSGTLVVWRSIAEEKGLL